MKRKNIKEILERVLSCIVITVILIIILLLMPDLLWFFRTKLSEITILKFILVDIDKSEYLPMMLTIISCCISAGLSYTAYCLSKEIGQLSKNSNDVTLRFAAYSIKQYIQYTSKIIRKAKKKIVDLSDLEDKDEIIKQWIQLCLAVQFSEEEEQFFYTYNKKITQIIKYYKKQNESEVDNIILNFCSEYFDTDDEDLEFNKKTKNILDKLDSVFERGES